ncbi:MAG: hypothetical protein B0D92_08790 [Spirochaeta sp. LUC14_002_19_P3]|nr:MAG: hypothetical protein B0D92_08790 [Spirochaeta sp. LUC14_002_19_P3]
MASVLYVLLDEIMPCLNNNILITQRKAAFIPWLKIVGFPLRVVKTIKFQPVDPKYQKTCLSDVKQVFHHAMQANP